jgi:hypothetical protein
MKSRRVVLKLLSLFAAVSCGAINSDQSRFLGDVDPTGDFGTIEVQAPSDFDLTNYSFAIHKPGSPNSPILRPTLGAKYILADGSYCLRIQGPAHIVDKCSYIVEKKKRTIIGLGVINLKWNQNHVDVQLGPKPNFELFHEGTKLFWFGRPIFYEPSASGQKYLFPAGKVSVAYGGIEVLSGEGKSVSLTELSSVDFDITPPDLRIAIDVVAERNRFPIPKSLEWEISSYGVLTYSRDKQLDSIRVPVEFAKKDSGIESNEGKVTFQWVKIPLFKNDVKVSMRVMAYPVSIKEGSYSISVSGVSKSFSLSDLKPVRFELEPVNISHINETVPGFYKYFLINDDNSERPIGLDFYGSRHREMSRNFWFPTQSTLFVLRGNRYRLDTYLKDDAGAYMKQSVHSLDYR